MNLEPPRVAHTALTIMSDTSITVRKFYDQAEPLLYLGEVPVRAGSVANIRELAARIATACTAFEAQGVLEPEPAA